MIGVPFAWPSEKMPSDVFPNMANMTFLKSNGALFDVDEFPILALLYPDGKLDDLRGLFIRGWDDGRGLDSGRLLLTEQGDAIRNIRGHIANFCWGPTQKGGLADGVFTAGVNWGGMAYEAKEPYGTAYQDGPDGMLFDASTVIPTADENRPRNIAFSYIVRAN